jgi:hypothetical protein
MIRFHLQCNQLEFFREAHSAAEHYQLSANLFFLQLTLVGRALESLENQNIGDQG